MCSNAINILPLGSGALAGTSLPIDRAFVAKRLGFPKVAANSIDAVSDRDFAVELLGILASIAVHLSRLSEDFILWATEEFGILALDDSVATGSSLMPQKKNPDVLELIRGGTGLIFGHLQGFLTMLKGQPLSYNRDMQWDKRFIFEAAEEAQKALKVLVLFIQRVRVRKDRIRALLSDSLCATDLAEHLVQQGVAFSKAHAIVGSIISFSEKQGIGLGKLSLAQLPLLSCSVFLHFLVRRFYLRSMLVSRLSANVVLAARIRDWLANS
ncbi:MAG: argininosuccinate lyase [Candidatus Omnitrophica bacterium]|nr:argininosuccinate lyase [Candidatus Omnitrophota bacterium]